MSKYLFNGIPLPELPEYDATTRPYSYIARSKDGKYYFVPRTSKTNVTPEGAAWLLSGLNVIYVSDGNAWVTSNTYDSVHYIVWANYDVMYVEDTSTLYLAASEPVPVLEIQIPKGVDRYSYIVGFNLGLAGFSFPYSKPRKPTAYLYNGIRLPALPEWDREMYPYAAILNAINSGVSDNDYVSLLVSKIPLVEGNSFAEETTILKCFSDCTDICNPTAWDEWVEETTSEVFFNALWANHDIYTRYPTTQYYPDGIMLYATDPVPVYENMAVPPTYLFNGVELPELPEWDKEKYPYALIYYSTSTKEDANGYYVDKYSLHCLPCSYQYGKVSGILPALLPESEEQSGHLVYTYTLGKGDTDWHYCENGYGNLAKAPIWSNFDILKDDGTVYLAASEPTLRE